MSSIPDLGHLSIHVKPDKESDLMVCNGRFEVPRALAVLCDIPYIVTRDHAPVSRAQEILDGIVYEAGKLLIAANLKRDWHFRGEYGVKVDYSELQLDLNPFGSTSEEAIAVDQGVTLQDSTDMVALIVKMAFVVPKIRVETFEKHELPDAGDGFVDTPKAGELVKLRGEKR